MAMISSPQAKSNSVFQLSLFPPMDWMDTSVGLFREIRREVEQGFSGTSSHDQGHIERVYTLCMHIGRKEKANLEVLGLAALLHDIGRQCEVDSKGQVCHAEKGAMLARALLERHSVDETTIKRVVHCIKSHRFRGTTKPRSKEARILFDADKLDSIGAIGIGRAFLFAGEIGANLHNDGKVPIEQTKPYTKDDTAYREFMIKLRQIKDRMLTEEGRGLAQARHSYMVDFFDRLNKEMTGDL